MSEPARPAPTNPEIAFEATDWSVRAVAAALLGVLAVVVIAVVVLRVEFATAARDVFRPPSAAMPAPRLEVDPAANLAALRAREDRDLNTYYWVDRSAGRVHIPIAEAMKRVAAHGLDGFPASPK